MTQTAHVVSLDLDLADVVGRSVELLNRAQGEFEFKLVREAIELPPPDLGDEYSWGLLGSALARRKERLNATYLFGVLSQPIQHNWFSRTLPDLNVCFITTKDWEYLSSLPLLSYVAYEIAENLSEMLVSQIEAHDETRGCLWDMVMIKPHISFKIRTADICSECLDQLNASLPPRVVQAFIGMLEEARRVALGRSEHGKETRSGNSLPETVDREFPFPLALCFRLMQGEVSYTRKWLRLKELSELIIKYVSIVLLAALREPADAHVQLDTLRRPSTGHWNRICFDLLKIHKESKAETFISRYIEALDKRDIKRAREASDHLVKLRNDTMAGHGSLQGEKRYESLYGDNLAAIQTLLEFVSGLTQYPLIQVGQQNILRGMMQFPAQMLMGSNPTFQWQNFSTHEMVDSVCNLHDPSVGRFLSLYPWLVLEPCRECEREALFLYDKIDGDEVMMREYQHNHTQKRADLLESVETFIP